MELKKKIEFNRFTILTALVELIGGSINLKPYFDFNCFDPRLDLGSESDFE